MPFMLALGGLSLLLAAGLALRVALPVLGRLMLPVALVGGAIGLAAGPSGANLVPPDVMAQWTALPAVLINVVFAALFIGAPVPSVAHVARTAGPLVRFSLVNGAGQYVVGFGLTALVLTPLFGVPDLFGCLIEVGFSGGHGTASAMASVFAAHGFPAGAPLGQMSATVGLVTGVVGGMWLVQWGVARGHAALARNGGARRDDLAVLLSPEDRRPIATATVHTTAIEPFTLHAAVLAIAVLGGWLAQRALQRLHPALAGLPVFPLAMIAGMLLQALAQRTGAAAWLDRATVQRLSGLALDLLVTAAVASMRLDLVVQHLAPLGLLMAAGIAWCVASFVWIAPRMLRGDWFEQGLTVYGTQTGVAAVGLMLLRAADPDQRTSAAQAFAARSLVISPLLGGGLVTAAMPLLVVQAGLVPMLAATTAVTLGAWWWPVRPVTR